MSNPQASQRSQYRFFTPITTRWSDNDIYGHVNNVVYYSYFDSVANLFLIQEGALDIHQGESIGYVVNSSCSYFKPIAYPAALEGGLQVIKLGNSSVQYGIAIFEEGQEEASAAGTFTHVFVDRVTERPIPIAGKLRTALASLLND